MTPKQKLFVKEYLVDLNATRAAIAAGCSEKSAHVTACRWLKKANVQAELAKAAQKTANKLDITAEKVLGELAKLSFSNMLDYMRVQEGDAYVDLSKLTREQAAAIQELTVEEYSEGRGEEKRDIKRTKFKLAEKRGSLELLGKYLKLFTDRTEVVGLQDFAATLSRARARASTVDA